MIDPKELNETNETNETETTADATEQDGSTLSDSDLDGAVGAGRIYM